MNAKFFRNGIVMLVLVVGTVALLYTWLIQTPNNTAVGYSQFLADVQGGRVTQVVQQDQSLTVSFEPSWTTDATWPAWTSSRNFEYGWPLAGLDCETTVKTTASATTTRASITMPLRKNLGFNGASD